MKEKFVTIGIVPTDEQIKKFDKYTDLLLSYNGMFNLTAITDKEEIEWKHYVDSAAGLKYLPKNGKIIDVGSGAGFLALPLCILDDGNNEYTLCDSLNKRVNFLKTVCDALELKNVVAVHRRAEEEAKEHFQYYDAAVARAVASLPTLLEYTLPLLKKGGVLIAYKGDASEEIALSQRALKILGGKIEKVETFTLNDEYSRSLVIVRKVADTPLKYPRNGNKPRILPL